MAVLRFYSAAEVNGITLKKLEPFHLRKVDIENCFYVELEKESKDLTEEEISQLQWILSTPFCVPVRRDSLLPQETPDDNILIEIGPRLNFSTALSTNAVSICHSVGLENVIRIEVSTRYLILLPEKSHDEGDSLESVHDVEKALVDTLHDKMTQCRYKSPLTSFDLDMKPDDVFEVQIMTEGKAALEKANTDLGLAFDSWDLNYYTDLFRDKAGRNPTSVECFDLAQSNSEHSRHWFFKGRMFVDGKEMPESLFQMVMSTQNHSNSNNVIKFCDNSSAIVGYPVKLLYPAETTKPSQFTIKDDTKRHVIFTAETHNFPTGVAPFPGATTGTGGRIRDVHAAGRGAHVIAGTAGYCFGNLNIPGYNLPWEDKTYHYPSNFASPLEIAVEASNGASDYGNKFGEPVLSGFARSFGLEITPGNRREYIKPIMFSGGIGALDHHHVNKMVPSPGMEVIKLGGPVYRIGVGGGAASSIQVQGDNASSLDFGAVQRGDAEMEQKLNRVIRACIELGKSNPICSVHDQGAGGNGNVLKEICEPAGAEIRVSGFQLGDPTISILELWGAEYQENTAILIQNADRINLKKLGLREKCPVNFVGSITGDGKIRLVDDRESEVDTTLSAKRSKTEKLPVDLDLEMVLGNMPSKEFHLSREKLSLTDLNLDPDLTVMNCLERVLRLPSVASKRYLTNKVDRSVTGLVAQQQCVGPLHTPLADVAVIALSHFDIVGGATAIGEQPIKGLVDADCGARMTVGEALTNLVFARITDLKDVKCSGNWMWPAKLPGEGALLVDTCRAMCDVMKELGIAIDGGKDSLSMAARVGNDTVKAPGTLVVSVYAACPDITATVTPDLKCPNGSGVLLYVPLNSGHHRLGGSALAQCYKQLGNQSPDLDDSHLFSQGFQVTQQLIKDRKLISGHDVSDGGVITCILEMAFAGNCGVVVDILADNKVSSMEVLFCEELGLILEVESGSQSLVVKAYQEAGVTCNVIGSCHAQEDQVSVSINGQEVLKEKMTLLRDMWEETSFQLEHLQTNPACVEQEKNGLKSRVQPEYKMTFEPESYSIPDINGVHSPGSSFKPKVAVIREEGSNGDREMCAAFHMAGFEVWDVTMYDLTIGSVTLDQFSGVVFVGGFSYADVFGSAKGWAATLKFHKNVKAQFDDFYKRTNTFSLGVCNGCQLMALLGWVAPGNDSGGDVQGAHLAHNSSQRFESRFSTVKIEDSPAMMLKGMAGSILGIWVAHGEGRMTFQNSDIQNNIVSNKLVPLKYVDDNGEPTEVYPQNPNGSPLGIAALCSPNGRHLAMMPHPERCVLPWQWPWMPQEWNKTMTTSPWFQMFRNAHHWCCDQQEQ